MLMELEGRFQQEIANQVNAALQPVQSQLAELMERLGPITQSPPTPLLTSERPPPPPPAASSASRRKPLPNPPKFSGIRAEYAAWASQMRNKIELDADLYDGNHKRLWYLINACLDTKPQKVVATFVAAGGPNGAHNPDDFMAYLDRNYKDTGAPIRAANELRTLRQRDDQSLAGFLPKFEQKLAEAGGADWADQAKIIF